LRAPVPSERGDGRAATTESWSRQMPLNWRSSGAHPVGGWRSYAYPVGGQRFARQFVYYHRVHRGKGRVEGARGPTSKPHRQPARGRHIDMFWSFDKTEASTKNTTSSGGVKRGWRAVVTVPGECYTSGCRARAWSDHGQRDVYNTLTLASVYVYLSAHVSLGLVPVSPCH
jgi:hypothetical protein